MDHQDRQAQRLTGGLHPQKRSPSATTYRKEQEEQGESARARATPPPPDQELHEAMDAVEARDGQRVRTEPATPPGRTMADLAAAYGAVVRDDRDLWEGLIRVYGFGAVSEACRAINEDGRSRAWFSKVQEHLTQTNRSNDRPAKTWGERVLPMVAVELEMGGLRANAIREAVEQHAGMELREDADRSRQVWAAARYWLKNCPESVQEFIDHDWLPPRDS